MDQTKSFGAAESWLQDRNIEYVECILPDYAGTPRGKSIPVSKFLSSLGTDKLRAPESLYSQTVNGEFIVNDTHTGVESDMVMVPDLDTLKALPWTREPTASVICDTEQEDGTIGEQSPRNILRHITELLAEKGWKAVVAPEFEFFLIDRDIPESGDLQPPRGPAGQRSTGADHMSIDVKNGFSDYFADLRASCVDQGMKIESLVQEAGPAQFEMNLLHGDPLHIADQSFLFKRAARQIAQSHGLVATFLARPYSDTYGSSMHLHQSIVDAKTGENIFADADGKDSDLFLAYIAGLQKYMPAVMIFLAPYRNSFGRFGTGFSVPANTNWGRENRTVGLRVPDGGREARRIENRIAGSDVNPYLAIASSLACGYLGITEGLRPDEPHNGLAGEANSKHPLPRHLLEAMDCLEACEPLKQVMGSEFVTTYLDIKKEEYRSSFDELTPWDKKFLIHNV